MFNGKNVLITGGMGFIGSNLAIKLVQLGANVTVMDSMLEEYGANIFNVKDIYDEISINYSDMRDENSLKYIIRGKDIVFNLAGQVSHQDSMTNPFMDLEVNTKAQLTLLETCRQFAPDIRIVFSSTRQIYGRPQYLPVDEKHPLSPPDVNGINKLAAEEYHRLYYDVYGLKTVSLRLTNTYGPRQLIKNARQGVIGWFINRAVTGETIKLFGTGEQVRDFNYVDDVTEAMCAVAVNDKACGQVFNLSGERASLKQIANMLIELTGKGLLEVVPFPEERKKIDIGDFYGDSSKLTKVTGWEPRISLKDGLERTVDYYLKHAGKYLQ